MGKIGIAVTAVGMAKKAIPHAKRIGAEALNAGAKYLRENPSEVLPSVGLSYTDRQGTFRITNVPESASFDWSPIQLRQSTRFSVIEDGHTITGTFTGKNVERLILSDLPFKAYRTIIIADERSGRQYKNASIFGVGIEGAKEWFRASKKKGHLREAHHEPRVTFYSHADSIEEALEDLQQQVSNLEHGPESLALIWDGETVYYEKAFGEPLSSKGFEHWFYNRS